MNVLVTGGAGYIGSVIVEALLRRGHTVTVLDSLYKGHRAAVTAPAALVQIDLADREQVGQTVAALAAGSEPAAVIHMAADSLVGESMQRPTRYFRNNVINSLNLAEAVVEAGVGLLVFSSTAAVYGEPETVPITEAFPTAPTNVYGETKLAFERVLRWLERIHGLRWAALRYFNAAGATERLGEDHAPESHLIPNILQVPLGKRERVALFGTDYPTPDGTCIRDYVHVADLADAHVLALEALHRDGVPGHPARRAGDPAALVASSERIRRDLGWAPRFPGIEEIVGSAWAWHRGHPNGYEA